MALFDILATLFAEAVSEPSRVPTNAGSIDAIRAIAADSSSLYFDREREKAAEDIYDIVKASRFAPEVVSEAVAALNKLSRECDFSRGKRTIRDYLKLVVNGVYGTSALSE